MLSLIIAFFSLQIVQSTHMAEELVNKSHLQMKEEERRQIVAVKAFSLTEKRIQELNNQLTEANRERKSVGLLYTGLSSRQKLNANNSARLRTSYQHLRSR